MIGLSMWVVLAQRAKGYDARRAKRNAGLRRVVAYALALSLLLGLGALHRAKAAAAEAVRGVGRDLAALSDLLTEPRELRLNGEAIRVSSSATPASVTEALDRFEESCATTAGLGVYRSGDDVEGAIACGGGDRMRYVYAKRTAGGTHVLAAWTDRPFRAEALAPEGDEDAPGTDSAAVPRPARGRRLLTAEILETTYAVRVYSTPEAPAAVLATYDETMTARGYDRLADDAHPTERSYVRGGVVITMVVAKGEHGTSVTIAEM